MRVGPALIAVTPAGCPGGGGGLDDDARYPAFAGRGDGLVHAVYSHGASEETEPYSVYGTRRASAP